jgi:hypothetical protein
MSSNPKHKPLKLTQTTFLQPELLAHCVLAVQTTGHFSVPVSMGVAEIDNAKAVTTARVIAEKRIVCDLCGVLSDGWFLFAEYSSGCAFKQMHIHIYNASRSCKLGPTIRKLITKNTESALLSLAIFCDLVLHVSNQPLVIRYQFKTTGLVSRMTSNRMAQARNPFTRHMFVERILVSMMLMYT